MLWVKISFLLVPFNSAENLQTNVASIKSTWIHKQNAKDWKKNSCYILHGDWIIQLVWNTHGWLAACIESPDACSFWYKVKNFSIQFWMRMCQLLYNVNAIYIRSGTEQKARRKKQIVSIDSIRFCWYFGCLDLFRCIVFQIQHCCEYQIVNWIDE